LSRGRRPGGEIGITVDFVYQRETVADRCEGLVFELEIPITRHVGAGVASKGFAQVG
jgi:hypothetical protein